jgi:hypothetical protein
LDVFESLLEQAVAIRIAVRRKAGLEKVRFFTSLTVVPSFAKQSFLLTSAPESMTHYSTPGEARAESTGKTEVPWLRDVTAETRKKSIRGVVAILAMGLVFFLPALLSPLFLDDYLHRAMVEGTFPGHRNPFDLYSFIDDGNRDFLLGRGVLPWWTDRRLTLRFFRPLTSFLLWADHRAFSHVALPLHVHSFAWWAAAVLAVRRLYTRFFSIRATWLATLIFALSPCHALPLSWAANRETLVSMAFGTLALCTYLRWRENTLYRDGLVALGLFALTMLGGGEYALCFGGYIAAIEVSRREYAWRRRLIGVMPFVVPALSYMAVRTALGYGVRGSGYYSDPLHAPIAFLMGAPSRAVSLLATSWLSLDSEAWRVGSGPALLTLIVLVALPLVFLSLRWARASLPAPTSTAFLWLALGSLMAMVPVLAVVSARRLVGVSMVGIAPVVAVLVDRVWFPASGEPRVARGRIEAVASLAALALGFAHLVHGPLTSLVESARHRADAADFASRMAWIRGRVGDTTVAKIGVLRDNGGAFFAPFALDAQGRTPAAWRVLMHTGHALALRRDARTLDLVAAENRSLFPMDERNLYRGREAPFRVGDEVVLPGIRVTILKVEQAGPRAARFVFSDDPSSFVWLNDDGESTKEVALPEVGFGTPFDR